MTGGEGDADLVRRDQALLGLPLILDPGDLENEMIKATGSAPRLIDKQYIRYKPHTNCLVTYLSGSSKPPLYAKAYADEFAEKLNKHRRRVAAGWASDARIWTFPDKRIMVRQFPEDGRLRSLSVLANSKSRECLLRRVFPNHAKPHGTTMQMLAYKPERRFVAKLCGMGDETYVLKFYRSGAFQRSLANLRYLKITGCEQLPKLCGKSKRRQVIALNWSPGQTLRERLVDCSSQADLPVNVLAAIGTALAQIHRLPASLMLSRWTVANEITRLEALSNTLGFLVPEISRQAQELCNSICRQLAVVPIDNQVVHGDFHSKQILVDGDNVRLLDADELAIGPAQLDAGTFIAHLHRDGLSERIPRSSVKETVDAFIAGYEESGGNTDAVDLFTALALFKFSHHPFRAGEHAWRERICQILQLTESFAASACRSREKVSAQ